MFELACGYRDRGMAAYAAVQDREFALNHAHGSLRRARKLGIDVERLRAAPAPLYTSKPLFDSSFCDKLTQLFVV